MVNISKRVVRLKTVPIYLASFLLVGCATTASECDPQRVSNVFASGSCAAFGGFNANLQQARSDLEKRRQVIFAANQQEQNARIQFTHLQIDRAELDRRNARLTARHRKQKFVVLKPV